jgi:ACS family hexuronate transporter-like MFS transporter
MTQLARSGTGRSEFRWTIVALLFVLAAFNYIDRTAIFYPITAIATEFHLNDDEIGLVLAAFGIGYFITTLAGGIAVDRWGARRVVAGAALVWFIAMGGAGLAAGLVSLFLARMLLGLAEGPNFPATSRAVSVWLAPTERATALAHSLVAVPLALAVRAPIVTLLLATIGWRYLFLILGLIVLAWIPFWLWLYRDDPGSSPHVSPSELEHIRGQGPEAGQARAASAFDAADWRFVLTNRTLLANSWAFFVFGYFVFFFMTWLPDYLQRTYGLGLKEVGLFSFLPWFTAALLLWSLGLLSDALLRRTGRLRIARSSLIMLTQLLAALAVLPVIFVSDIDVVIGCISLAVGFSMGANTAYYATTIDVAPSRAGTALGVMNTWFALSGFAAPAATGYIVSLTGSFDAAFWLLAALAGSSVVVVFLFHRPDDEARLAA